MNLSTYQPLAFRTAKMFPERSFNLTHAALGCFTEGGEFATEIKRHRIYGRDLSVFMLTHCREELGDFCWYIALAAMIAGIDLGTINVDEVLADQLDGGALVGAPPLDAAVMMMGMAPMAFWMAAFDKDLGIQQANDAVNDGIMVGLAGAVYAMRTLGFDLEEVLAENIEKLRIRFPEKYTDDAAEARADKEGLPATMS